MSNLERIQKERLIALANLPEGAFLEPFLSDSIRIAYEAGYMQGNEADVVYHRGSYIKGIERAIALSDEIEPNDTTEEWRSFKRFRNTLRDELKKL